jgi:hypothetical protein
VRPLNTADGHVAIEDTDDLLAAGTVIVNSSMVQATGGSGGAGIGGGNGGNGGTLIIKGGMVTATGGSGGAGAGGGSGSGASAPAHAPFFQAKKGFAGLKALVGFRLKPVLRHDCNHHAGTVPNHPARRPGTGSRYATERWGKRPACRSDGAEKRQRRALSQPRVKP